MLQRHESDEALVDRLQSAAFSYFLDRCNPDNGLIADTSIEGAPCSIAATGFGLSSYPVAVERGWMRREDAVARTLAALRFFAGSQQSRDKEATGYRGFYYHFLDMTTGRRTWNCELSTIDSALLIAGILTAAAYFSGDSDDEREIGALADRLYHRVDWHWALNKGPTLSMGWRPGGRFIPYRWQGYSEAILMYVLALASPAHAVPESSYHAFTAGYDWQTIDGRRVLYAGPLFVHLFSHAWIDFRGIRDACIAAHGSDYIDNTKRAIDIQRAYAGRNPGNFAGYSDDIWGLTACDGPGPANGTGARRGTKFLGYAARGAPFGPDDGTLAPWAPLACLPFAPEAALAGTRALLLAYPDLFQDGRFPGSFNPSFPNGDGKGWVDDRCVGLDHGLLVMMIENHRSGLIWELMRRVPAIRTGLERAGFSGGWIDAPQ